MTGINASIVTFRTDPDELTNIIYLLAASDIDNIYIVDNSPDDHLRHVVDPTSANYMSSGGNIGYGAAHNIAIRLSLQQPDCRYHLVVNSDIDFDPKVIEAIKKHMDDNEDIGQLIPRVNFPDGRLQSVVRLLPTPLDVFGRRFLPRFIFKSRNARYTLAFWDHNREANVAYHQGSFMFLRTDTLRKAGIFDERFFMYPEDIDLTRRIHAHSRTVYWPGVTIVHHHRASSYKSFRMLCIHMVNMIKYFNKWGWFFDRERRRINLGILKTLGF